MKTYTIALLIPFLILTAGLAHSQGVLISVSGPPDTSGQFGGNLPVIGYPEGVSWIAMGSFSNITISVALGGDTGAAGIAYLTTSIGPGTTTADEVASASFAFPSPSSLTPVLSGLDLVSGTYYLTLQGTATGITGYDGYGLWEGTPSPSVTSAGNVVVNGEYFYDNAFQGYPPSAPFSEALATSFEYEITGVSVPEPSAPALIIIGSGIVIYVRRVFRRGGAGIDTNR